MAQVLATTACRRMSVSKFMDGCESSCFDIPNSLLCDLCEGRVDPLITKAIEAPGPAAPGPAPTQTRAPVQHFTPRPPPAPPLTSVLTAYAAQANSAARKQHGECVKELMERFAGCFVCRIRSADHSPCHDDCGNSGVSGCKDRHVVYTCFNCDHSTGWMEWKKTFIWPGGVRRCYFCGLPNGVVPFSHRAPDAYPGICKFSDTAVAAAWHVLHTPALLGKLKTELGFVPRGNTRAAFATWLTGYGSDSEDIRLLSVFSWLCRQYYPDYFN
jgi:hypothetical protein